MLLIISFNIASLILAHAASMRRETALRIAIGAGRARILRISAFESLLVVAAGATLGFGLSLTASRALLAFWDSGPGRIALDLRTDLRLFAFIVSAALLSALVAGLVPAL
ncbi:MAG: FtsX-like permease family protein [Bryobacterales bacterium]|nr:FtsX-like permease family protein [Bryobacterales bacterium]